MSSKDESHSKVFPDLQDFARNHKVSLDSKRPQFLHIHQMLCNCNNPIGEQTNKQKLIKMLQKKCKFLANGKRGSPKDAKRIKPLHCF